MARCLQNFRRQKEAREWIQGHLPSGGGTCLLHGDLLPQNLLWNWEESSREEPLVGIVAWEMARIGDPAYDLAIVSRRNRNVHGVKEGVEILVEEYLTLGGRPIELTDVRVHELLLILHWLEESLKSLNRSVSKVRRESQIACRSRKTEGFLTF